MVGGIYTVLATKAQTMQALYGDDYITVGPDLPRDGGPPNFREDPWLPEVLDELAGVSIGIRMGRWLIPGEPKCLLINFADLFAQKDEILTRYWEKYGLDSLLGEWDYLEPVMFAHGAGVAIELLARHFYLEEEKQVVVHAHEWLSGASLLHLREALPEVATVFTTHATQLGRALSSRHPGTELNVILANTPGEQLARERGVAAKWSMEATAARTADCFTAVSEMTAEEARLGLDEPVDIVTPNALGDAFPDPALATLDARRTARARLLELAHFTTGTIYDPDTTRIVLTSGRYEFENKGIDIFIESLDALRKSPPGVQTVAFMLFPTAHNGPRRSVMAAARGEATGERFVSTHDVVNEGNDPVLRRLSELGIANEPGDAVHAIFVPIYLDGRDALVPESYYQLLAGADFTAFPSLYEPWGYTPLESIGYAIPTISSDLAGFALWAQQQGSSDQSGVWVLRRRGRSREQAVADLTAQLRMMIDASPDAMRLWEDAARQTARRARWVHFSAAYARAHEIAIEAALRRGKASTAERFRESAKRQVVGAPRVGAVSAHLREFLVLNRIPAALEPLREIARNAWWSWRPEAAALFAEVDPELWAESGQNPVTLLHRTRADRLEELAGSAAFLERLATVHGRFREESGEKVVPEIAYFCAEFGLLNCLRVYSGGLGTLAGDFLKSASDLRMPVCGVGLAYHRGYFRQRFRSDGSQEALFERQDFLAAPMEPVLDERGDPIIVTVAFPGGPVHVRAWRVGVGNVNLYLLDTDFEANRASDRSITDSLYGGDNAHRLRQELILGIGGYRMLRAMGLAPKVYHMNEGHSAFLLVARLEELIQEKGLKFEEALEYVRHTSVFTTHTPVAAGHDRFPEELLRPYFGRAQQLLHKDWDDLLALGRDPAAPDQRALSMTFVATNGSHHVNAVSRRHAEVSREMFRALFPGRFDTEIPVTYVTNGVHTTTWLAPEWQRVYDLEFGPDWRAHLADQTYWQRVAGLDDELTWRTHGQAKRRLVAWLQGHLDRTWRRRRENPGHLGQALAALEKDPLIIGFARRFAPYKRATLLFDDLDRLAELLAKSPPVVFLFAGKAHPSDEPGQDMARRIVELSREPRFREHIILLEDYEIAVAQLLVSGCDVWLNTPTPPLEASGTSGMKAALNGVLNLSVADGWWPEGYDGTNGWIFGGESLESRESQDDYDSEQLYALLEHEVIPEYYRRDERGVPLAWVTMMKDSIASVLPRFSTDRMAREYYEQLYQPALESAAQLGANAFRSLIEDTERQERLHRAWADVGFEEARVDGLERERLEVGQPIEARVTLRHPGLSAADLRVEVVVTPTGEILTGEGFKAIPMECEGSVPGDLSHWAVKVLPDEAGPSSLGFRVVPAASEIRGLVRWL